MPDSSRFNRIVIVDSIPVGESNTACRLYEDLYTLSITLGSSHTLDIEYERVESDYEFLELLSKLSNSVKMQGSIPMLHIECHGDEHGFQFADKSILDWSNLKKPLTVLNQTTKLNLMIAAAACVGGATAKTITFNDRAPFWGLIGPTKNVLPAEIERPFRALYTTLLQTVSAEQAIAAMEKEPGGESFWATTAQGLFKKAWGKYKSECCSPEMLEMRAERMLQTRMFTGNNSQATVADFIKQLTEREPMAFEHFRRHFFMEDLYPEHRDRFNIHYEDYNNKNERQQ